MKGDRINSVSDDGKLFLEGKNEVPMEKKGYNITPAGKIEKPKPSPTPPPAPKAESK